MDAIENITLILPPLMPVGLTQYAGVILETPVQSESPPKRSIESGKWPMTGSAASDYADPNLMSFRYMSPMGKRTSDTGSRGKVPTDPNSLQPLLSGNA